MERPKPRPALALPEAPALAAPAELAARLGAQGVALEPAALARMGAFLAYLLAMNEQVNLTAITSPDEAWTRHVEDSLTLLPLLAELRAGNSVVDVGSGGGVPAIPLAIARPDLRFTLVEATQKKAAFLSAVAAALGLDNVAVCAERAEALRLTAMRASFHAVTARAVGKLKVLVPLTAPFARAGGLVLLIKGQRADEELAEAAGVLRYTRCTHERTVPTPTGRIVVLRLPPARGPAAGKLGAPQ